ncbi:MAG: hypothetical protein FJ004_12505 [Chloroflexi bacterium]|nr:hypothetical protein [Chloroflexota bacterium]
MIKMARLERHIADYAQAIEDGDWGKRSMYHKDLCDHLGVGHSEFRPFEGHNSIEPHWHIPRARAARAIREALDRFMAEKKRRK